MIIEGLVTTLNEDGSPRISPMGPMVDPEMTRLVLRPFPASQTFGNLKRNGQGVFHVTDDVELIARASLQRIETSPPLTHTSAVEGVILSDACRWYAFRVVQMIETSPRAAIECEVIQWGWLRDFAGFNRAKHAVLEAAILATRLHLLPGPQVYEDFRRLRSIVQKTGGDPERRAFRFLEEYLHETLKHR